MKFNLETWIAENEIEDRDSWGDLNSDDTFIMVSKLEELLKTHAIVPREPSEEMITAGSSPLFSIPLKRIGIPSIYKAMIAEAEKDEF
ncbi:hypothetical protein WAX88_16230 [Photobacterium damselae subsp. damselae]|uniref:hypothetical protein n=1 Tax=Photobacterium damselae TaxID=38293 RepID=UPI00311AD4A6